MAMTLKDAKRQSEINAYIEDMIDTYINPEMRRMNYHSRLRTCSASVYETEHFYILKSYNTFIAAYNKESCEFIDFLRLVYGFTHTSASHIAKFRNDFARNCKSWIVYYPIPSKLQEKIDKELDKELMKMFEVQQ